MHIFCNTHTGETIQTDNAARSIQLYRAGYQSDDWRTPLTTPKKIPDHILQSVREQADLNDPALKKNMCSASNTAH